MGALLDLLRWVASLNPGKPPTRPTRPTKPDPSSPPTLGVDACSAVLALMNLARSQNNLGPFDRDAGLDFMAQDWAQSMAAAKLLNHGDWLRRFTAAYPEAVSGSENIAEGQRTPAEVMGDWMNSAGHKRDILGDYSAVGIGLAAAKDGTLYWVCDFAKLYTGRIMLVSPPLPSNASLPGGVRAQDRIR